MDLEEVLGLNPNLAAQIAVMAPWLCAHPGARHLVTNAEGRRAFPARDAPAQPRSARGRAP